MDMNKRECTVQKEDGVSHEGVCGGQANRRGDTGSPAVGGAGL